jgi:hypothetical protein
MTENIQQTDRHGAALDDVLARDEQAFHTDGHTQQSDDYDESIERGGTPDGMSRTDVEVRSEIARFLGTSAFPGDRERLVLVAAENHAPDEVVARLRSLPPEETFTNVQDVARTLGLGVETHRN